MEGTSQAFGAADWLVILVYFAGMVAIGILSSRRQEDAGTYFLGGRNMPTWAVALSVLATSLSAATFVGAPQIAYAGDLTYLSHNIGGIIAAFVVALVLIPPIYRAGTVTIYGYLGKRYGVPAMVAASIMFLCGRLLASGARLFMAGIGFALILYGDTTIWDLVPAVVVLGFIGTLYTVFGGIKAVIWTDTVQIVVVVFAALLSVYLLLSAIPLDTAQIIAALRDAGGQDKLRVIDTRFDLGAPFTLWAAVIAATFATTSNYGVDHDMAQRMMTAKSPWRGGAALVGSTLLGIPVVLLFLVIGLLLSIYYGRPDLMGEAAPLDAIADTKRIYPQFLLNHLPLGLRGLAMAGLFAAAMSSFDSAINAMASTAVADVYVPWRAYRRGGVVGQHLLDDGALESLHTSRMAVAVMGAILTGFAILAIFLQASGSETLISFALGVMAFANAPLLGVFLAAILTKRGNTASVFAALLAGVVTVLLLQPYMLPAWLGFKLAWPWWWVIVTPLSFVVCVAGKNGRPES